MIIGAGFIGCEVAASLRTLGVDVVLVEPQPTPLASVLGEQIGELVARLHRAEGVDVRCGVGVSELKGTGHVEGVVLSDGTELDCRHRRRRRRLPPVDRLAEGSGVEIDNGVVCDVAGRTSAANVWAIGDVASWRDAAGHQVRVEHWSNVAEQARVIVPAMLGVDATSAVVVPYFWSDQYDVKIQCLGEPEADDVVHVVADDGRKFLAYYERDGAVVGVVGGGMPGKVMKTRMQDRQRGSDRRGPRLGGISVHSPARTAAGCTEVARGGAVERRESRADRVERLAERGLQRHRLVGQPVLVGRQGDARASTTRWSWGSGRLRSSPRRRATKSATTVRQPAYIVIEWACSAAVSRMTRIRWR